VEPRWPGLLDRGTLFHWGTIPDDPAPVKTDEPLSTDRPDFTESSTTVGRGVFQLEAGYTFVSDDEDGVSTRAHSFPEPLLRVGILADWLEARVAWNWVDERVADDSASGSEDLYLGFKLAMTPQQGFLPEMALIPQMTVPTGSDDFTADKVLPGVNWIYAWEITDSLSTAGSTQFNQAIDPTTGDTYTEWAQSWTIAASLTDNFGTYAEYFVLAPMNADSVVPENYFNGGFTYLFSDNIQWDIRGGVGLNNSAADYFLGTGLSVRVY
jgi:hypothetical protein